MPARRAPDRGVRGPLAGVAQAGMARALRAGWRRGRHGLGDAGTPPAGRQLC